MTTPLGTLDRARFLAEVSALMSSAPDPDQALDGVARLAVPRLADAVSVHLREADGSIRARSLAHADPARSSWARTLAARYPPDPDGLRGVAGVLRSGEPEWLADVPDEVLAGEARDPEHLALLRELGMRSYLAVPLMARGTTLGVLALVTTTLSGRRFVAQDLELATDLATRVAAFIDSGRLIEQARAAERALEALTRQLEQRVADRTAQLEAVNRELALFADSVSHDLRAPARQIAGFARLLAQHAGDRLDPGGRQYLDAILEAAEQAHKLVEDLLGFSRLAWVPIRRVPVDMADLCYRARTFVEKEAVGRAIDWHVEPLPVVLGEPSLLRLVWINLLSNAVKFTRRVPRARIEIGVALAEGAPAFHVRDNGAGFDVAYADRLFGVFQRLHSADEFEGTGIGLANVRRIVARHGGRTWAEGAPGAGATFHFSLPPALGEVPGP